MIPNSKTIEMIINNVGLLLSTTNKETPYEHLLQPALSEVKSPTEWNNLLTIIRLANQRSFCLDAEGYCPVKCEKKVDSLSIVENSSWIFYKAA